MQGGSAGLVTVSVCKRLFCSAALCVRSAQNCAHSTNYRATRNYNPSICRPVPSERSYKNVQRAEMLRNVEAFKKHKKLLLIFEQQDFWTILSESFSGFSEK